MKRSSLIPVIILVVLAGCYFTSCKKDIETLAPPRQFATSSSISISAGATSAVLTWKEAVNVDTNTTTYTVQMASDTSFVNGKVLTYITNSPTLTVTDSALTVRAVYYARVKTNGATASQDSHWVVSSKFSLTGEQIFLVVKDIEIRPTSVILRWHDTTNAELVKIVLTPNNGTAKEYPLTKKDIDSGFRKIDSLLPNTKYHAQIFSTAKEKGYLDFITKVQPVYAFTVNSTMDLAPILDTCQGNIIIGLDTGYYNTTATYAIKSKSVTLMSLSGNPLDTRVYFKEIKLMGDGAGINLIDIGFDGQSTSNYFLNFAGLATDAAPANFANVSMSNCRVYNYTNCLMRANRATNAGDQKIGSITINNCVFYNNTLLNQYTEFTLDKLGIQNFTITNSTFSKVGRALISMATTLPASLPAPIVLFDKNTVNNFGTAAVRPIFDASANPVVATFTNNIIANTPRVGTVTGPELIRGTAATSAITFSNNNYFKLTNGSGTALTLPSTVIANANQTIDLGWDTATVNFMVPTSSPLRSAGTNGGLIGDPRWQ